MTKKQKLGKKNTVNFHIKNAACRLKSIGIDAAERNAQDLLAKAMRVSRTKILCESELQVNSQTAGRFEKMIIARLKRKPLQYLIGREEFMGMSLKVGPGVLIPRPETELLILEADRIFKIRETPGLIADLGTGSGNLAFSLKKFFPHSRIFAIDCSSEALFWARRNQKLQGIQKLHILKANVKTRILQKLEKQFSLVVSNPPYIPSSEIPQLQLEVQFEPKLALDGGEKGLDIIELMLKAARRLLTKQGVFVCEIGIHQSTLVKKMFKSLGFTSVKLVQDWQKIPRIISGVMPE